MKVTLRHEIEITASSEMVYSFFDRIADNYTKWHPDHIDFRWDKGNSLKKGAVACVKHKVGGKFHDLHVRFTNLIPNQRVEFEWGNPNGSFFVPRDLWLFEDTNSGCRFVSECELIFRDISSPSKELEEGIAAVRKHFKEEVENLKRLMESADGHAY